VIKNERCFNEAFVNRKTIAIMIKLHQRKANKIKSCPHLWLPRTSYMMLQYLCTI